jgi:hypothetical protein
MSIGKDEMEMGNEIGHQRSSEMTHEIQMRKEMWYHMNLRAFPANYDLYRSHVEIQSHHSLSFHLSCSTFTLC